MTNKEILQEYNTRLNENNLLLSNIFATLDKLPNTGDTAPTLQDKEITIKINGTQNVTYDEGYDGLNSVKIITDVPGGASKYAPRAIAFYRYKGTELDEELANLDTSKLTSMEGLFYYCSKLKTLDLSGIDLSNVTYMGEMFIGCSALTSVNFGTPGALKVTNITKMFSSCSALPFLDLSNFDMSNVTTVDSMFAYCSALESVNLNNINTSKVTNMYRMFYSCSNLSSIDLSSFDTSSVTSMSQMFHSCRALTSVNISNFDTSKLTNTTQMFISCSSLTTLIIDNPNVFPMTSDNMLNFTGIANGEGYVYVPDDLVETYKTTANWSTYADQIKGISELPTTE